MNKKSIILSCLILCAKIFHRKILPGCTEREQRDLHMNRIGFDNDKYVKLQSQNIRDRISKFGGKLYLEFGGKLFDDFHASRVLPGFAPDSKV